MDSDTYQAPRPGRPPGDPHSPLDGFFHAHLGWIFAETDADPRKYCRASAAGSAGRLRQPHQPALGGDRSGESRSLLAARSAAGLER